MNHLYEFFSTLSIVFYLIGFFTYIYNIYYGKVFPHPMSWGIWWIFAMINVWIYFDTYGIQYGIIPIGIRFICLGVIAGIGMYNFQKYTYKKTDFIFLLLSIIISITTRYIETSIVVGMMILIDFLIFLPTLQKLWKQPETEHSLFWFFAGISQLTLILSMNPIQWETTGFWIYAMILNLSTAYIIHRRKLYLHHWKHKYKKYLSFLL